MKRRRIGQLAPGGGRSIGALLEEYRKAGVLGAGDLAKAAEIYREMLHRRATVFLGLSGPLVPSGLRSIFAEMIRRGHVSAVVTSGGNMVHDMIEAFGGRHYVGSFRGDDRALMKEGMGRMGNALTRHADLEAFEKRVGRILASIPEDKRRNLSSRELFHEIGARIKDEGSILRAAYEKRVPIFSPAVVDSALGLELYLFSLEETLVLNAVKDMGELAEIVTGAESSGAIILGGGVPKHYILGAHTLRGGIDYGFQITMDREEAGSLSGARLEEGRSWGKAKAGSRLATVIGDVTVLFPLLFYGMEGAP